MNNIDLGGSTSDHEIAILVKDGGLKHGLITKHYLEPMRALGVKASALAAELVYETPKKAPVKLIKQYLEELLPNLRKVGTKYLFCCDANYFKVLAGQRKAEVHIGYVLPCAIKGYEDMHVILCPNYQGLFYNPATQPKIDMAIKTLADHTQGDYKPLGGDVIHFADYPKSVSEIKEWLQKLMSKPALVCDIEAFSLRHYAAGIGTVGFAWNKHEGIAFPVDYQEIPHEVRIRDGIADYGANHPTSPHAITVRTLLRQFFENYEGAIIYHGATFDAKVLIYQLYMDHILDQAGMLKGLEVLTKKFHCTKVITYLATNSCAGNKLGLKENAHEFAGNWAQDDIKDIKKIPMPALLKYNLVDCLSTWFVMDKHQPTVFEDKQDQFYKEMAIPSLKTLIQTELSGLPLNMPRVLEVEQILETKKTKYIADLRKLPELADFEHYRRLKAAIAYNDSHKVKRKTHEDFKDLYINPNSGDQIRELIYEFLDYEVIDLTDSKQAATGAKTIKKLKHVAKNDSHKVLFDALIGISEVSIILNNFIKNFKEAAEGPDGWYYLFGGFNFGGTVSGRLSSSQPNLQNLPSGKTYGKLIKSCFEAAPGWLFVGADYASLEDRISALTTKDPNKLKVYTDGYDGHCLRAYSYFKSEMPDIENTVESINSIKKKYPLFRDRSKAPTFLLTYQGTYMGLVQNVGLSKKEALAIEKNYHEMYVVSDEWVQEKLKQACVDGYVTVAFGLRVRTPLLARTYLNSKNTPYAATAEGRTAGNALGQSYGLLNSRAGNKVMEDVWDSEFAMDIKPAAQIHDALYFMVRQDLKALTFLNKSVGTHMSWQGLPEIQHPEVKLSGELDVFYPNWAHDVTLPNDATQEEIKGLVNTHFTKMQEEGYV